MFELQYYTKTGYVKSIEITLNKKTDTFEVYPVDPIFIKGITIKYQLLDEKTEFEILSNILTPLEQHFLNINYGFFPELKDHYFRNENERIVFDSPILREFYNSINSPKM